MINDDNTTLYHNFLLSLSCNQKLCSREYSKKANAECVCAFFLGEVKRNEMEEKCDILSLPSALQ